MKYEKIDKPNKIKKAILNRRTLLLSVSFLRNIALRKSKTRNENQNKQLKMVIERYVGSLV